MQVNHDENETEHMDNQPNQDDENNTIHSNYFEQDSSVGNEGEERISFTLLNSILKCSSLPGLYPIDESSSTLTFGFWYTLQDDIISLDSSECTQLMLTIKPYYRDLVCIMLTKSMFPSVDDNSWSLDDKEVFRCYRQDIADTFMYCYAVLNLEMLDILNTKLNESLEEAVTSERNGPIQWNRVETVLHAFGAVAESIEYENLYLPKLMNTIKDIPFNNVHVRVMATALETVGAYSEWLMDHPYLLENVFPLILSGLANPEVSTSATMALKDITHNCQKYLTPFADHILITSQSSSTTSSLETKLKILAALFSSLHVEDQEKVDQPILVVMQNVMPLFRSIGEKYCRNQEVIEELSVVIKYGVTTLKDDCKPLISNVLQLLVTIYRECPQANILIVAKTDPKGPIDAQYE
ncbi:unnamed protein product [Phaedon cochleariae]|uniref:Importin-13 n=1 Tax=Phaedon cochleariae TaxID=80249 RepID=A0A9N9SJH0_PHACE|nr:unnamed protein product [Phaedon cochleariae]